MLGHYSGLDTLNLGLASSPLFPRAAPVSPFSYQFPRQDHSSLLLNDYASSKESTTVQGLTDAALLHPSQHGIIKSYGSVQFLNQRNIDNDINREADYTTGIVPEPEEVRRKTVGGSALESLIAEFRNNSLGDDLRKLKEAHKEIIEDLKTAFFQKKPKKRGISKEKAKNSQNPKRPGLERRETLNGQVRRHSPSPPRKPFLSDMNPQSRPANLKTQKQEEFVRKPATDNFKSSNSSGAYHDKGKEGYRYIPGNLAQPPKNMQVRELAHEKVKTVKFQLQPQQGQKKPAYPQSKSEDPTFDGLDERVVEEIMGLREVKISLMKQLNQETSNYNRVILENKKIQSENIKLREQLGSKQNVENIPYVEQLSMDNQKMREKISKLEHQLHKANQELRGRDKIGTENIRREQNLNVAEREIERLNGIMKSPKPQLNDSKSEVQKLKDQLAEVHNKNQRLEQDLDHYRSMYGRVDGARIGQSSNLPVSVGYNVEHRYQNGPLRHNKW